MQGMSLTEFLGYQPTWHEKFHHIGDSDSHGQRAIFRIYLQENERVEAFFSREYSLWDPGGKSILPQDADAMRITGFHMIQRISLLVQPRRTHEYEVWRANPFESLGAIEMFVSVIEPSHLPRGFVHVFLRNDRERERNER